MDLTFIQPINASSDSSAVKPISTINSSGLSVKQLSMVTSDVYKAVTNYHSINQ